MKTRVEKLRERRRAECDARFQTMLARLETEWRKQLQIKNPDTAHAGRADRYEHHEKERN